MTLPLTSLVLLIVITVTKCNDPENQPCPLGGGPRHRHNGVVEVQYRRRESLRDGPTDKPVSTTRKRGGHVRSTRPSKKPVFFRRTTPYMLSFLYDCDYLAYYCLRTYSTGTICGRAQFFRYHSFTNYCLMEYINCIETYDVWQMAYVGECNVLNENGRFEEYKHYPYENDYFLDQYYPIEYGNPGK